MMTAAPGAPPAVTRPDASTEAVSGLLLLQVTASWSAPSGVMAAERARVPLGSSSTSSPGVMVSPVGSVGETVTWQVSVYPTPLAVMVTVMVTSLMGSSVSAVFRA